MAINCYCGLQGSGKSYEAVSGPIIEAIMVGRNVVTNIDGINEEKIHEYLVGNRKADQGKLGHIVHVTNERIMEPEFFPDEEKPELPSVVKAGDFCAFDEIWRFWGDGVRLSHEHMQFFRMHRHYAHASTGVTCDVILMTQDITGICRALKNVIEFSFRMHKMKTLGMPTRYRVEMYEGWKQNSKTKVQIFIKKYNKDIFPLYKSYAAGNGTEKAIDKRQNVFANPRIWAVAVFMVLFCAGSVWGFVAFWNHQREKQGIKADADKPSNAAVASAFSPAPVGSSRPPAQSNRSDLFRIAGEVTLNGEHWIAVADGNGRLRLENPAAFVGRGVLLVGTLEGKQVTTWTGAQATQTNAPQVGMK